MIAFELTAADFRAAVYRHLTSVQEVIVDGQPTIGADCPRCRRMIVRHTVDSGIEDNARELLRALDHVRVCR